MCEEISIFFILFYSDKKPEEKKSLRPPSCLLLPATPEYGGGKPKPNKKTNTHVLIEFGLEVRLKF